MSANPLPPTTPIGIIGAGTMGAGIAQIAALAGHPVLLYDTRPHAAQTAIAQLRATLDKLAAKGRLTAGQVEQTKENLQPAPALEALANCGLILEAIVEDLNAKRTLFAQLEASTPPETLFATNTSSLSITAIAAQLRHPGRLAGMHFFNPAPLMPLVEIITGLATSPTTLDTLEATAQSWGKRTVRARSTPGFIVNRVARPFYAEALRLLTERAADPATLDALFREAGSFRMGPFELMDLIGHDINFAVTRSVFEATFHDPRFTPSLLQKELVDANRLGRKTGQGFYAYAPNTPAPEAQTLPPSPLPSPIRLFGNDPLTTLLRNRLHTISEAFELAPAHPDLRLAQTPHATLYRTDGRSATQRAQDLNNRNVVLVDLAHDYNTATHLGITAADQASPLALPEIAGLLQAADFAISPLDDAPGMALMRTVAMLANEAADAVHQGICTPADCDKAMLLGANYPLGPLAWADTLGPATLVTVLDHLHATYGDPRYRVSPLLRRKALTGKPFHPPSVPN
jgi:3-hydroxybutyryl-CoA dehydrogenase